MKPFPITADFIAIARRVIWFKQPQAALNAPIELMTYAMRYATAEDMAALLKHVGNAGLAEAIDARLPGTVDPRSWAYWNLKIGRSPPPPLPVRAFRPMTAEEKDGQGDAKPNGPEKARGFP